jgi:hypothetical protein
MKAAHIGVEALVPPLLKLTPDAADVVMTLSTFCATIDTSGKFRYDDEAKFVPFTNGI